MTPDLPDILFRDERIIVLNKPTGLLSVPGIGRHFVDSALNLDRGLIMSTVLVYAAVLILFNMIVDALYALIDPRTAEPAP